MHQIFKNEESRLPSSAHSLRPDCSAIHSAETSEKPEAWLFHPTGITFEFDPKVIRRYPPRPPSWFPQRRPEDNF